MSTNNSAAGDFGGNFLRLLLKMMLFLELLLIILDLFYPETSNFKRNMYLLLLEVVSVTSVHFCLKKSI